MHGCYNSTETPWYVNKSPEVLERMLPATVVKIILTRDGGRCLDGRARWLPVFSDPISARAVMSQYTTLKATTTRENQVTDSEALTFDSGEELQTI